MKTLITICLLATLAGCTRPVQGNRGLLRDYLKIERLEVKRLESMRLERLDEYERARIEQIVSRVPAGLDEAKRELYDLDRRIVAEDMKVMFLGIMLMIDERRTE